MNATTFHQLVNMNCTQFGFIKTYRSEQQHTSCSFDPSFNILIIMKSIMHHVGQKWTHKTDHRQRHSISGTGDCRGQCCVSTEMPATQMITAISLSFSLPPHSTTFITCPADPKMTLGIKLPFLVMIIKNLKKYFTFEVQVNYSEFCTIDGIMQCRVNPLLHT